MSIGDKFILVKAGGKIEVHGSRKLAWTKLTKTVAKGERSPVLDLLDDVSSWNVGKC